MQAAIPLVAEHLDSRDVLFIALGDTSPPEQIGRAQLRFIPYEKDPERVAHYYQAADVYLHAARADTFPNAVLEALACGTPVVATSVGGIPEQIKSWQGLNFHSINSNRYENKHATGILVPPGNAEAMAESIRTILSDDPLRWQMSKNASRDASERFNIEQEAECYLDWYTELTRNVIPQGALTPARWS
jgi:glycosyltransferase involved in cell wall biosynthesis